MFRAYEAGELPVLYPAMAGVVGFGPTTYGLTDRCKLPIVLHANVWYTISGIRIPEMFAPEETRRAPVR